MNALGTFLMTKPKPNCRWKMDHTFGQPGCIWTAAPEDWGPSAVPRVPTRAKEPRATTKSPGQVMDILRKLHSRGVRVWTKPHHPDWKRQLDLIAPDHTFKEVRSFIQSSMMSCMMPVNARGWRVNLILFSPTWFYDPEEDETRPERSVKEPIVVRGVVELDSPEFASRVLTTNPKPGSHNLATFSTNELDKFIRDQQNILKGRILRQVYEHLVPEDYKGGYVSAARYGQFREDDDVMHVIGVRDESETFVLDYENVTNNHPLEPPHKGHPVEFYRKATGVNEEDHA